MTTASSSSSSSDSPLSLATILHMITVKLSPTNYLLWRNQIQNLLAYQKLSGHIDGSLSAPPPTKAPDAAGVSAPNPDYVAWLEADQKSFLIIQASLAEVAMAETLGLTTAHDVWNSLQRAYRQDSQEMMQTLKDTLRQLQKGSSTVSEFGAKFKGLCDELSAISHPVNELDKCYWFLCGLGA